MGPLLSRKSDKNSHHRLRKMGSKALASAKRTKAALSAAKQRGVRLESYGAETLAPKYRAEAKVRAKQLAPIIRELQRGGYSMRGIANELKKRRVQTPRGGSWHPHLVKRVMQRLGLH